MTDSVQPLVLDKSADKSVLEVKTEIGQKPEEIELKPFLESMRGAERRKGVVLWARVP